MSGEERAYNSGDKRATAQQARHTQHVVTIAGAGACYAKSRQAGRWRTRQMRAMNGRRLSRQHRRYVHEKRT